MYVPSSDLFVSPASGLELYDGEDPVDGELPGDVQLWDAGTEVNGGPVTDPTGAPRQGTNSGPAAGATEAVVYRALEITDAFEYADVSEILQVTPTPQWPPAPSGPCSRPRAATY